MHFFVTTSRGLEAALADEIQETADILVPVLSDRQNLIEIKTGVAGVHVKGGWPAAFGLNVQLATASRVLWILGDGCINSEQELHEAVMEIKWDQIFSTSHTFAVYSNCQQTFTANPVYLSMKVKDAIVDVFRNNTGIRPDISTQNPDIGIHVRLVRDHFTISIDLSGEPLSNHHYRSAADGEAIAPLRENLAAGMLRYSGWSNLVNAIWDQKEPCYFERVPGATDERSETSPQVNRNNTSETKGRRIPARILLSPCLRDPMCGSGTLVIEAALALLRRAPNSRRSYFALEKLNSCRNMSMPFSAVRSHIIAREKTVVDALLACEDYCTKSGITVDAPFADGALSIRGSDSDAKTLKAARACAEAAGVARLVRFDVQDVLQAKAHGSHGLLITNPPYGERLETADRDMLYKGLGDRMKQHFSHWAAWIISSDTAAVNKIGLRPTRSINVFNGNLACKYLQYVMYPRAPKEID